MSTTYWIKLYHEILRDPKMARLPDRVWRRAIELFLLAGQIEQDGILPEFEDIAWQLRVEPDGLLEDMRTLERHGLLTETEDGWIVTHFATRQGAASNADRVARYRDKKRHDQYTGNEVVTKRYTEERREEERRVEEEPRANAFTVYQSLIGGTYSPVIVGVINDEIDECERHRLTLTAASPGSDIDGDAWVAQAIIEAHGAGKPYWNYAKKITGRWRTDGYKSEFVYHGPGERIVPKHTEVFS